MNRISNDPPQTPLARRLRVQAPPRLEDIPDLDNSPSSPSSPLSPIGRPLWPHELAGLGGLSGSPSPRVQPLVPSLKSSGLPGADLDLSGEVLGHGAFSKVVKARDGAGTLVAVKFLRKGVRGTLDKEALLMEKLKYPGHPHVVPLLAVWQGGLVMPMYEQALDRRVAELAARPRDALDFASLCEPVIDRARFFDWAHQLASALQYVHARGIVHGDLKPDNILCRGDQLAICDFAASAGADNAPAFSPIYSSREVRAGQDPRPRDDVYSLGVVLLFCATGQEPYNQAKNGAQRLMWMAKVDPQDSYGAEDQQRTTNLGIETLLRPSPPSAGQIAELYAHRMSEQDVNATPPMSP